MKKHLCHAEGCIEEVLPKMFMCYRHWRKVPNADKDLLWALYRSGQEITKDPSDEYVAHAMKCVEIVARKEGLRV